MIDTHCHLDLYKDPHFIAKEVDNKRITTIAVTNLPSHFKMALEQVSKYKNIRLAIGLHPLLAEKHKDELPLIKDLIDKTSYLGEIGLDFSQEGIHTKEQQIVNFRYILDCAKERPRFISLHTRGAEASVLEILKDYDIRGAVFHWFNGSRSILESVITEGHYVSINTAMINSRTGQMIINNLPMNRVLTETDGPYIQLKGKPVRPVDVEIVLGYLSRVWNVSHYDAEKQVKNNFMNIVSTLKKS
jgi:TatD DNase family protein